MADRDDSLRILIGDDDKLGTMSLRRTLEGMRHEVVVAGNAEAAWECLEAGDFQMVITGWTTSGVNGADLCRRLRDREAGHPYVYVLALTTLSDLDDPIECRADGPDDYLARPFGRGELLARVAAARRVLGVRDELDRGSRQIASMNEELQRKCARLGEVASVDGLTGLKNRRHFHEILESSFSFASRHQLSLSVVLVDVDHFKNYNDTHGHPVGDEVLAEIGRILQESIREHDVAARYGGEEFVLILPGTDALGVTQLSERIRERIECRDWDSRRITASFGAATSSVRTRNALQLVAEADQALYEAKRRGRNCVAHFEDAEAVTV